MARRDAPTQTPSSPDTGTCRHVQGGYGGGTLGQFTARRPGVKATTVAGAATSRTAQPQAAAGTGAAPVRGGPHHFLPRGPRRADR